MSPSPRPEEAATVMEASFEIDPSGALEINVPNVHLELRPETEEERVRVHGFVPDGDPEQARELFDRQGIATHQSSDRLYVYGEGPAPDAEGWRWRRSHPTSAHLELQVPASLDVEARVPGGTVDVAGLSGTMEFDVMGGSVEAKDLQGPMYVHGGGGTLTARGCTGPQLDLEWSSGKITLEHLTVDSTRLQATSAPVDLQDLRGTLDLLVNGAPATLRDVKGSCEVQVRGGALTYSGAPEDETSLTAVGGPLHSHLPASQAASVTLSGEQVFLDEAFSFDGERTTHRVEGTLNGGGPSLLFRAIRGPARCSTQNDA